MTTTGPTRTRPRVAIANVPAMGGNAHLTVVDGPDAALTWAAGRLQELERAWTRFSPDSELSGLNAGDGRPMRVGSDTFALVAAALDAWERTDGAFDPTVHDCLVRAGYDRSFADLPTHLGGARPNPEPAAAPGCASVVLDRAAGTVTLGRGVRLDPGGLGKGLAADIVATELVARGAAGACVNIGGDLRVVGRSPAPGGWVVAVEDPFHRHARLATLLLDDGGLASSSTTVRRWGDGRHHVIDPRTGRPTDNGIAAASVIAPTAALAEVLTTALMVTGPQPGPLRLVTVGGAAALVFPQDGAPWRTAGWPAGAPAGAALITRRPGHA